MPYQLRGTTIYSKSTGKWRKKQTCKSVSSAKRALSLLRGLESGSIKPSQVGKGKFAKKTRKAMKKAMPRKKKKWTRKVDTKMKDYGDIDYKKKIIRVNPKKGELLNTIEHEEAHKPSQARKEKEVKKIAQKKERNLTIKKAIGLLKKYKGRTH